MRIARSVLLTSIALVLFTALPGCKEDDPGFETVALSGTVESIDRARSRVQISFYSEKYKKRVAAEVVVTPETEIFINGVEARLEDVRIGERAEGEAVVTRQNDKRVVTVTRVRIERAAPIVPARPAATENPSSDRGVSSDESDGE